MVHRSTPPLMGRMSVVSVVATTIRSPREIPKQSSTAFSLRRVAVAACAALSLSACGSTGGPTASATVEVIYQDIGAPGYIDQTVTLGHSGTGVVVPTIEYTPLDTSGTPVEGVEVTTAFGSDRGLLVVTEQGGFDVLAFSGSRVREVVGVESVVIAVDEPDNSTTLPPADPAPLLGDQAVSKFEVFDAIEIINDGESQIAVRVVCLLYDRPAPGEAQQAEEIAVVAERIEVAPASTVVASPSQAFASQISGRNYGCDSLKAHLTP